MEFDPIQFNWAQRKSGMLSQVHIRNVGVISLWKRQNFNLNILKQKWHNRETKRQRDGETERHREVETSGTLIGWLSSPSLMSSAAVLFSQLRISWVPTCLCHSDLTNPRSNARIKSLPYWVSEKIQENLALSFNTMIYDYGLCKWGKSANLEAVAEKT